MPDKRDRDFQEALQDRSRLIFDPAGREVRVLADADASEISGRFGFGMNEVYKECLRMGICPYRYLRNREAVSLVEQLKLATSRVVVIGAGGLGGHVIHLLSRIGIGHLVAVDYDVFDETNLNRQIFCTSGSLGKSKSVEAARQVESINPGVEVLARSVRIDHTNLADILSGADAVVDGLDNVHDRLMLEKAAKARRIPLVHGALAGFDGQVMTVFPEDRGLSLIYGQGKKAGKDPKNPEAIMGVPALMPSVIATFQAMEVIKIILGRGKTLRNKLLHVGLEAGEVNLFDFSPPPGPTGPGDR